MLSPLAAVTHAALTVFHRIRGYTSPGTSPETDIEGAARYDEQIVKSWRNYLVEYTGDENPFQKKRCLELGPGPDLGAGLFLLAEDAAFYQAMDVNPLIKRASKDFYNQVLTLIKDSHGTTVAKSLAQILEKYQADNSGLFSYICQPDFDLGILEADSIDLVLSQAAFEHFNDPLQTINQLSRVVRPGGVFLAQVDLMTHTPFVRDIDPLSIYRLPDWYYRGFHYPGIPNRVRPDEYVKTLSLNGWSDITVIPTHVVDNEYLRRTQPHMASRFRHRDAEMSFLSVVVLARRDYIDEQ